MTDQDGTDEDDSSYDRVLVARAQRTISSVPVGSVAILIGGAGEFPRPPPGRAAESGAERHDREARLIVSALHDHLPGGTFCRVVSGLLSLRASHFVVSYAGHAYPVPAGVREEVAGARLDAIALRAGLHEALDALGPSSDVEERDARERLRFLAGDRPHLGVADEFSPELARTLAASLRDLPDDRASIAGGALIAGGDRHRDAIARDVHLGLTSQQIRDEIIGKVGAMLYSRTPEMNARYAAAVYRESGLPERSGESTCTRAADHLDLAAAALSSAREEIASLRSSLAYLKVVQARTEKSAQEANRVQREANRVQRDVWRQEGGQEAHDARRRDLAGALVLVGGADWVSMIGRVASLRQLLVDWLKARCKGEPACGPAGGPEHLLDCPVEIAKSALSAAAEALARESS